MQSSGHAVRVIGDYYGRRRLVGLDDRALLGCSRRWVLVAGCAVMACAGLPQYGFGMVFGGGATEVQGAGRVRVLCALGLWMFTQGLGALLGARASTAERGPRAGVLAAAGACAVGGTALAGGAGLTGTVLTTGTALAGGGGPAGLAALVACALGGLGAGVLYSYCLGSAVRWYPERVRTAAGLVTAAYPAGAALLLLAGADGRPPFLRLALAGAFGCTLLGYALLAPEPPPGWWPAGTDPRAWALARANRRARQGRSPRQALATGAGRLLFAAVLGTTAVAVLDLGRLGTSHPALAGVLAAGSVLGRLASGRVSGRLGQRRAPAAGLALAAVGQLGLFAGSGGGRPRPRCRPPSSVSSRPRPSRSSPGPARAPAIPCWWRWSGAGSGTRTRTPPAPARRCTAPRRWAPRSARVSRPPPCRRPPPRRPAPPSPWRPRSPSGPPARCAAPSFPAERPPAAVDPPEIRAEVWTSPPPGVNHGVYSIRYAIRGRLRRAPASKGVEPVQSESAGTESASNGGRPPLIDVRTDTRNRAAQQRGRRPL